MVTHLEWAFQMTRPLSYLSFVSSSLHRLKENSPHPSLFSLNPQFHSYPAAFDRKQKQWGKNSLNLSNRTNSLSFFYPFFLQFLSGQWMECPFSCSKSSPAPQLRIVSMTCHHVLSPIPSIIPPYYISNLFLSTSYISVNVLKPLPPLKIINATMPQHPTDFPFAHFTASWLLSITLLHLNCSNKAHE